MPDLTKCETCEFRDTDMARVVREVGPRYVFVENSPTLTSRPNEKIRRRGNNEQTTRPADRCCEVSNTDSPRLEKRQGESGDDGAERETAIGTDWWLSEPAVGRVAHGVAHRVDRLKAIGNGQVPAVVRLAWNTLVRE